MIGFEGRQLQQQNSLIRLGGGVFRVSKNE
jgi:hypothetical protein